MFGYIFADELLYLLYFVLCRTVVMVGTHIWAFLSLLLGQSFLLLFPKLIDYLVAVFYKIRIDLSQIGVQ